MNAERHQQVKQVFLAACDLQPPEVAAFLDRACAGDAELRQEVESLLVHHLSETIIGKSPTDDRPGKTSEPAAVRAWLASIPAALRSRSDFRRERFWPAATASSPRWGEAGWETCTGPTT